MDEPGQVTRLLKEVSAGNHAAMSELLPLVYGELHQIAANYFRGEREGHTLQPTALVNEAYLRLVGQHAPWENHVQFMAVAAVTMRRILVDHARSRARLKRGSDPLRINLYDNLAVTADRTDEILAIDQALGMLSSMDPVQARLVELRFFGGLSVEETAAVLKLSTATVKRQWHSARAWLHGQLASYEPGTLGTG
jgi:RNA polymerase sigma factor (TIGR02999 family)